MPLLDENPNTPERTRRFNQILARLINRGFQAGLGLNSTEGVLRVNAGRSLFIPDAATGVACLLEDPACVLDFLEVDLFTDGGLEHADDASVSPNRDRLKIDLHGTPGLELTSTGIRVLVESDVGLEIVAGGVQVNLAGTPGLEFSTGIRVKVPADVGLEVVNDGVQVNLHAEPGLEFSTGMRVLVSPAGGIVLDGTGISVSVAALDHGGLAGLTDILDHPGYLDLGGTRPMTGDLDMGGNDIVGAKDIIGLIDTSMAIRAGAASASGAGTMLLEGGAGGSVSDGGSISLLAGSTIFGGGTSGGIALTTPSFLSAFAGDITLSVGTGAGVGQHGEIVLKAWDGKELKITHDDPPIVECGMDFDITGALDVSTTLDVVGVTNFGDDVLVTGGDLIIVTPLTDRLKWGDGDSALYELSDDLMVWEVGGSICFICAPALVSISQDMLMATGKTLTVSAGGHIDMNGTRLIGDADADSWIDWSVDDVETHRLGGTDSLDITTALLDGKGQLTLTGFGGRRVLYTGGYRLTSTGVNLLMTTELAITGKPGWLMQRAGSIVSLSMVVDINAINASTILAQVYKDTGGGATLFTGCFSEITTPIVGNGQVTRDTFANGTYTFAAGDVIAIYRRSVGTSRTTDDVVVTMEVEFDD